MIPIKERHASQPILDKINKFSTPLSATEKKIVPTNNTGKYHREFNIKIPAMTAVIHC